MKTQKTTDGVVAGAPGLVSVADLVVERIKEARSAVAEHARKMGRGRGPGWLPKVVTMGHNSHPYDSTLMEMRLRETEGAGGKAWRGRMRDAGVVALIDTRTILAKRYKLNPLEHHGFNGSNGKLSKIYEKVMEGKLPGSTGRPPCSGG